MKTNVNALKTLFVKLGGDLDTIYTDIASVAVGSYDTISAMIEACAKVSGAKDTFVVTGELDAQTGTISNISATVEEIKAAVDDGKEVVLSYGASGEGLDISLAAPFNSFFDVSGTTFAKFAGSQYDITSQKDTFTVITVQTSGETTTATSAVYALTAVE